MAQRKAEKDRGGPLLLHPSRVADDGSVRFGPRNAARQRDWAQWLLANQGIHFGSKEFRTALQSDRDPVTHHAAWLFVAATAALNVIETLPENGRLAAHKLFTIAFHAGARHESITVEKRYRRPVVARRAQDVALLKATTARQQKHPPKITMNRYHAATNKARRRKELPGLLGVKSLQAVRDFESKHGIKVAKART